MPLPSDFNPLITLAIKHTVEGKKVSPQYIFDNYLNRLDHRRHDDFINKFRSELLNIMCLEETDKKINNDYYEGKIKALTKKHYQQIYNTLIYLAKWKPLNAPENGKIICAITLEEIQPGNTITVSTGHRFDATALQQSFSLGKRQNPITNEPFSQRDKNRVLRSTLRTDDSITLPLKKALGKTLLLGGELIAVITLINLLLIMTLPVMAAPIGMVASLVCVGAFSGGALLLFGTFLLLGSFIDSVSKTEMEYKQYKDMKVLTEDPSEPDEADIHDPEKAERLSLENVDEPYHPGGPNSFFSHSIEQTKSDAAQSSQTDYPNALDSDEESRSLMPRR